MEGEILNLEMLDICSSPHVGLNFANTSRPFEYAECWKEKVD